MKGKRADAGKRVEIGAGDALRVLYLTQHDFQVLKDAADGKAKVEHRTEDFRRLQAKGLVSHRFDDADGWPVAMMVILPAGREALKHQYD